ncbi:unnamed protein product [Chrysodeixis includens]|uniref:Uncharacterized protein n=1 Tax=Chrysodeixis includens TaxID=689277 RepID=A0A9N8PZ75_CHRIL|nr:unnamed protein product [Chrysodeixis includens]
MTRLAPGSLRLLAGAALLALALAQEYCNTATTGPRTGQAVTMEPHDIEPNVLTFEINEPDVCPDSTPTSLIVTACDTDLGPQVYLLDSTRGLVIRESNLEQSAHVYMTYYCPYGLDSDESTVEITESVTPKTRLSQSQPQQPSQSSLPVLQPYIDPSSSSSTESSQVLSDSSLVELPSIQMESRFSSVPKNVPSPHTRFEFPLPPSMNLVSRWKENESNPFGWMKHGNPSLVKRLSSSLPEKPAAFSNRTPSWFKKPAKGPSSPWIKQRSNLARPQRRSNSRPNTLSRFYDNDYSHSEDNTISLLWEDDPVYDGWWPEVPKNHGNNGLHRPYNSPSHRWKQEELPENSFMEHTSSLPIRHPPNYPSPSHKKDPPLLSEFRDKPSPLTPYANSKDSKLPKLLLLLQDHQSDRPVSRQKCSSAHSVEDAEPWWPNDPQADDDVPWQHEYPSDYNTDDEDDTWPMGRHDDEDDPWARHVQYLKVHPLHKQSHPSSEQCPQCPSDNYMDYDNQFKARFSPASHKKETHSPESHNFHSQPVLTERPMLSSTVRNSLSWKKQQVLVRQPPPPHVQPPPKGHSFEPDPAEQSPSPWGFLSRLLLSHPTFRESTHVIRI